MKLIQAMKQVKLLLVKAEDLRKKISVHCAHSSVETPLYGDKQREQVAEWLQAHSDVLKEILRLRVAIQRTNLATEVTIELGGKNVTKNIAAWIHRRRDLSSLEMQAWQSLTDRNLREGVMKTSQGEQVEVKTVRNFDPVQRDTKVELYQSEPALIDSTMEVINAVTDLIE